MADIPPIPEISEPPVTKDEPPTARTSYNSSPNPSSSASETLSTKSLSWIIELFEQAVESGSLVYHETSKTLRAPFTVYLAPSLASRPKGPCEPPQDPAAKAGPAVNPFSPYDENLFISDVVNDHVLLWNKFSISSLHMLLVPRLFEPQWEPLERKHFKAIEYVWKRVIGYTHDHHRHWIVFYNSGKELGGSQPHRHLQFVPIQEAEGGLAQCTPKHHHTDRILPVIDLHRYQHFSRPCRIQNLFHSYTELMAQMTSACVPGVEATCSLMAIRCSWCRGGRSVPRFPGRVGRGSPCGCPSTPCLCRPNIGKVRGGGGSRACSRPPPNPA